MSEDAAELTFELPTRPGAAGAARRALSALNGNLHLVSESRLRDLQLAATELVANAHEHAVPRGQSVSVSVLATDDVVRVEVHDAGSGFEPDALQVSPVTVAGGNGLKIVGAVVDRWGVERGDGTTVWFEVDRPRE